MVTRGHTVEPEAGSGAVVVSRPSTKAGPRWSEPGAKLWTVMKIAQNHRTPQLWGSRGSMGGAVEMSGTPMMTRVWNGAESGPGATGGHATVGWVPGLGEHPQSQNWDPERSALVGLWNAGLTGSQGFHECGGVCPWRSVQIEQSFGTSELWFGTIQMLRSMLVDYCL